MYIKNDYFKNFYRDNESFKQRIAESITNAKNGNMMACKALVYHYMNKRNEDYDPKKSFYYAQLGYKFKEPICSSLLAYFYLNSIGCEQDIYEAISILNELKERDKIGPIYCYSSLINLYLNDERYQDINKAIEVIKTDMDISRQHFSEINQISINDYPNKNEFRYYFDSENETIERGRKIKDIIARSEYEIINKDEFDEDFLSKSQFGKLLYLYLLLTKKVTNPSISEAKALFSQIFTYSSFMLKMEILNNDFEEYYFCISPFDGIHPLYLNNHFLDEDETIYHLKEMEKQAKYHVTKPLKILSLAYLGKVKYAKKDIKKAKAYLDELYSNNINFSVPYLASIFII